MKFPAFAFGCTLLVFGCQPAEDLPPAPPADLRFQTSDPARLYFNNIRSSTYSIQEFPERYTKSYILKSWPDTAASPFLIPTLVDYWLYDQAYIDLNWRSLPTSVDLPWTLICSSETTTDTLVLNSKRWGAQYDFAQQLHTAITQSNHRFELLLTDSTKLSILEDSETRRLFRLSWRDYQALTDKNK